MSQSAVTPIVECVPNFSEGRDLKKIDAIIAAIREVDGVDVVDVDAGADTNRTVVTLVGPPEPIKEAAFRAIAKAAEVIDMSVHQGAHARHGATDVCPFVPVAGVTMEDCARFAAELGERVGNELGIPVYLYDQAALRPERRSLAVVRKGEYEALAEKLATPEFEPDFGPAKFLPRTGVVTIGAREFLIAYNVNLNTRRKDHAADIASEIREKGRAVRRGQKDLFYVSGRLLRYSPAEGSWPCAYCEAAAGGLDELAEHYDAVHAMDLHEELAFHGQDPAALEGEFVMKRGTFEECRAVGWVIPEYDRAQITINLTNFKVSNTHDVLDECRRLALERGIIVTGSEIVGVVPYDAIRASGLHYLEAQTSSRGVPVSDVVESAIQSLGLRDVGEFDAEKSVLGLPSTDGPLTTMRVNDFADEVSRGTPAPGGGSIAALAGSLAAALASMVANLTHARRAKRKVQLEMEQLAMEAQKLKDRLLLAIDADTAAFNDVIAAMRLPSGSAEDKARRAAAIEAGYKRATEVPLETARLCLSAIECCRLAAGKGLQASVTDGAVGAHMARAGLHGAVLNVRINLGEIADAEWVASVRSQLEGLVAEAEELLAETLRLTDARL